LNKNILNQDKENNLSKKENNSNSNRLNFSLLLFISFLSIIIIFSYIYYTTSSDEVSIVTKGSTYPFKTFPSSDVNSDNKIRFQNTKVYKAIVEPDNIELMNDEIINTSYTDGTLLDEAEESFLVSSVIENENYIDRENNIGIIVTEIELPEPIAPSDNNSGVFIKTPTLVPTVIISKDLSILDQTITTVEAFINENNTLNINPIKVLDNGNFNIPANEINKEIIIKNDATETQSIIVSDELNLLKKIENQNSSAKIIIQNSNTNQNDGNLAQLSALEEVNDIEFEKEINKLPLLKPLNIKDKMLNNQLFESLSVDLDNTEIFEFKKDFYGIQVASVSSLLEADNFYKNMLLRYPVLLNSKNPEHINLVKVDNLGNLGTWYKVRIGPFQDRSKAIKLCSSLRDAGLDGCIVRELE
jgi:hypothetical protein